MARKDGPRGDFTKIGVVTEAPFVRLPDPAREFGARAGRLNALAADSPLGPYLRFLAGIVEAQHAVRERPLPPAPSDEEVAQAVGEKLPPLSRAALTRTTDFAELLDWLVSRLELGAAPEEARQARDRLLDLPDADRVELAVAFFDGLYPPERLAEGLYVAAAVQAHLARLAAQLDPALLRPLPRNACPACGSPPVSSLIVGWPGAARARYCCCSLCGTRWNYVRVKCTACASTEGIHYAMIEGGAKELAAETCDTCHSYIKHLIQHDNPRLDPFADDIVSHGLDLKLREEGYRPAGFNPLFISPLPPRQVQ